ncbi:MAG: aldose 1-epimerase family protein [Lachnospiraceae bacterium]|nr:aldose 1-epimerase family protein [Lachnospiraceae bacterium]
MEHVLENENLRISVADHGAELTHLVNKATGAEYIWSAEDYWKRHSPVLFPYVGNVADGAYSVNGQSFPMGQHGFARDMDFHFEGADNGLQFRLDYTEETLQKYPYRFHLQIGYQLKGPEVKVCWQVTTEDELMYFMIGAHPAFNCPPLVPNANGSLMQEKSRRTGCFVNFHTNENPSYQLITGKLVGPAKYELQLSDGRMELGPHSFVKDALIFEGGKIHELSLETPERKPFLSIRFDAPLFGIWSPDGDVPFVCLEPWYGRSDAVGFAGDISDREYEQVVRKGEVFEKSYIIRADTDFF